MRVLRCGLIGANIGRSRLAAALKIMCTDHGLTLDFQAIDTAGLAAFDLGAQVDLLADDGWDGVTVTHPWKTDAASWAGDAMLPDLAGLGAANTLTFAPRQGHNTDYTGFLDAWARVMDRAPGRVAVAGAGGVARAVVPALLRLGAQVQLWDPAPGRAEALAHDTGATAIPLDAAAQAIRDADGLVNCTALGMAPDTGTAFDPALIGGQGWAFDAVYTPTDTPFLRSCTARGLRVLTGFDLFRSMAMASFAAYTGHVPKAEATLAKLDALRPGTTTSKGQVAHT